MLSFFTAVHVIVAIMLMVLVLIQDSKSEGALGIGGGSKSLLGATGAQSLASKLTVGAAVIFAATSLILAAKTSGGGGSVTDSLPTAVAPNTSAPIDATQAPAAESGGPQQAPTPAQKPATK